MPKKLSIRDETFAIVDRCRFGPYNRQLPMTMCNAYNHPPWCECRWGGDTRSGTGLGWIPAPAESSRPAWADLTAHKQRLGYETTCFFGCEKRVFFHRDENGGCVLLDFPLGRPWQVHPCWEIHRSEQRAALNQAVRELEDLNFNGVFYPPTGRLVKRPRKGEFEVNLDGYVADNHVLYKEPQVTSIRSAKKSTYVELVEIDVADSDGRLFRFLMPRSAAERIRDYELVHVHGFWLKKRRRWFLLAGEVTLEDGSHLAGIPSSKKPKCAYCHRIIEHGQVWGIDPEGKLECGICGQMRREFTPMEFRHLCRRIGRNHRTK